MTELSACAVMAASTAHRVECQLDGCTQRYKIHMVQSGSENPKCFHTAVWVNPTAPLYDQLQQVNAVKCCQCQCLRFHHENIFICNKSV